MTDDELLPDYGEKLEEEEKNETKEKLASVKPSGHLKIVKALKEKIGGTDSEFLPEDWDTHVYIVVAVEVLLLFYFALAVMGVVPFF
ncbi:MAG: hypothetical protein ABEJ93_02500 [Candidatus Nanohalobium sp.]